MYYLISYPRTGNSFIRYAVEVVSKQPTYDYDENINDQYDTNIEYENFGYILRKEHFVVDIIEPPEKLILIIRDFKDVFISHHFRNDDFDKDKFFESFITSINTFWKDYYELLYFYDIFQNDKLLVYYDDIFNDSENVLRKVFDILNLYNYDEFLKNIDYHKDFFFEKYKNKEGSKSEGFSNLYNIYTETQIEEMNSFFRKGNQPLFDKYLKRFV